MVMNRLRLLKEGMSEKDVTKILGAPHAESGDVWSYFKYEGKRPPRVGEQYYFDVTLVFVNGRVKSIDHAWMDATGPQE